MKPAVQPSAATEWRTHWALVVAATAGVSLSAVSSSSLGVMMLPLEQEFGWTRVQISLGTSLVSFIGMALATLAGVAIDRLGPRRVALFAATLMCAGLALMATVNGTLWHWWALWALIGVSSACMPTVWMAPVSRAFQRGRGFAIAITLCGSGITTTLVPIVANLLVESHGWRAAYVAIAAIWAVVVLPLAFLALRDGPVPAGAPVSSEPFDNPPAPGLTAREGFRSPVLYKLALAAFFSMSAGVALILNLVPVLRSTGLGTASAAAVAGVIGVSTIVGRIAGGWLMDRFDAGAIAAVSCAGAIVLPAMLLVFPGSVLAASAGVAIYGLMGGAKVPAVVYLASRHFGPRAFGTLYSAVNTMIAMGVGLGPLAANYVFDTTQSYTPVMWAAVPFLLIAAALYLWLGAYPSFEKLHRS